MNYRATSLVLSAIIVLLSILLVVSVRSERRESRSTDSTTGTTENDDQTASSGSTGGQQKKQNEGANQLLNHDIYATFSTDPASFAKTGKLITESGSVPDVLICSQDSEACEKDEVLIYFVDPLTIEDQGMEGLSMMRSTDGGRTWSERIPITLKNQSNDGPAVDPSVVQLSDGTLRMYYYGPEGMIDTQNMEQEHFVYSAVSDDGVNFTVEEGTRFSAVRLTDPEVIERDGTWFMYYSLGTVSGVATSTNGLDFDDHGEINVATGGVPGALALPDGTIRVYGCTQAGIASAISDDGIKFTDLTTSVLTKQDGAVCDPALQAEEGGYLFIYKLIAKD